MSRNLVWVACLVMTLALGAMPSKASARTDVSINLRIGDPYRGPRLVFRDEPDIVVVPGSRVYYVRDYDYDLYRYGGMWYYNYDGGWYRARRYNGPFAYVGYRSVPLTETTAPAAACTNTTTAPALLGMLRSPLSDTLLASICTGLEEWTVAICISRLSAKKN